MNQTNESREIFNLFNPAFCAEILRRCVKKYTKYSTRPMPFPLLFLILPLVLHKETREKIEYGSRQNFSNWLNMNSEILIHFHKIAKDLVPVTKNSFWFLLEQNQISLDNNASITVLNYQINDTIDDVHDEKTECFKKAETIGRWFAKTRKIESIYSSLGVKP
ncbi:hypothetical protein NKOR_06285 [Candidatus Nitrosopumilus koreensis AR1]|uniref:Uncharacterized protein n=1 Tax=Candidatus Nitrosopumilus koreensis AR1 TaxID=1229908 RepID=K0B4N6_9ARCH|nr:MULTISPECIES: three component ABC system middle component [Nitrosopumilus]AFS81138.1 hypothetical protein NKOR_06285 [Candidatus Nitrosopumilus koreensis AR1]